MDALDRADGQLVDLIDHLHAVQAVDHPHLAQQLAAAGGLRLDQQRRHERPGFLDGDLRRTVGPGVLHVAAGKIKVAVDLAVDQFGVDAAAAEARDRAGGRIQLHASTSAWRASCRWPWPFRRASVPVLIVNRLAAKGGTSLARKTSSPEESRCDGTAWPCSSFDPAALGLLGQRDQIGPRPGGRVEDVDRAGVACRPGRGGDSRREGLSSSARDCRSASRAKACLNFHWALTNGKSGSLMLL